MVKQKEKYEPAGKIMLGIWTQLARGRTVTVQGLATLLGAKEATVSATIRNLRKERYGEQKIYRVSIGPRTYGYRLLGPRGAR